MMNRGAGHGLIFWSQRSVGRADFGFEKTEHLFANL